MSSMTKKTLILYIILTKDKNPYLFLGQGEAGEFDVPLAVYEGSDAPLVSGSGGDPDVGQVGRGLTRVTRHTVRVVTWERGEKGTVRITTR